MDIMALDAAVPDATEPVAAPGMHPISFAGCFGWLHVPPAMHAGDVAVLLCAGIKNDAMTAHRSFRLLADALALAGFAAMRFDYPGTGDSLEPESVDIEHWGLWQSSIHQAADWLRRNTGASRIVLVGFRLGAMLAASVVRERADVAGLVLLAPVLRGRTFMRQLGIEAKMHDPGAQEAGGIVLHELRLSAQSVARISQTELGKISLPAGCRVAVFAETSSPVLAGCVQAWRAAGADVLTEDFTGLEPMLRPVFMNHEASAKVARIADWMAAAFASELAGSVRLVSPPAMAELRPTGCIDTPLRFGPGGRLFGMLCRPSGGGGHDLVVIIGNSSGDPHCGFARVAVDFSRRLAAAGIAALRIDFAGLGDSILGDSILREGSAAGDVGSHVFETDRRADFMAAVDALAEIGYRRFAIQGLCSGAYHAFHAGVADPRISILLIVNIPLFEWQVGLPVEHLRHVVERPSHFIQKIFDKSVWMQLLRGEMDLRNRVATQGVWLAGKSKFLFWRAASLVGLRRPPNVAERGMQILAPRTRTLFLSGAGDASEVTLAEAFGRGVVPPCATILVVPGIDHALTSPKMQAIAAEPMIAFLKNSG